MDEKKRTKVSILLVESSRTIGEAIKNAFSHSGYKIKLVENGVAALESLTKSLPDCLITAQILPDIQGNQLCDIIKDGMEDIDIPVILYRIDLQNIHSISGYMPADLELNLDSNVEELVVATGQLLKTAGKKQMEGCKESLPMYTSACVAKAMEKKMDSYSILQAIFHVVNESQNSGTLETGFLSVAKSLFGCQVVALALNHKPVQFLHCGTACLSQDDFEDFCRVCKADFLVEGLSIDDWDIEPQGKERMSQEKLNTYRCFDLPGKNFIGKLYMASSRQNFFTQNLEKRIYFFTKNISLFLEQSLENGEQKRENHLLRSTLSKFVPKEIIHDLVKDEAQTSLLVNEMRCITILFCDIRNFTTLCEQSQPEKVVFFLNNYFDTMVNIIRKYGGSIDKFIGDGIMAIFGAPVSYQNNEERAIDAALEMRQALPQIQEFGQRFLGVSTLDYGIGVHCGDVIVGTIGCQDKTNYTVIGDSVNFAFRLEGITKKYNVPILVSQRVKDVLKDDYFLTQVDTVSVKGKSTSMSIYRLEEEALPSEYCELYQKALDLYYAGAWNGASKYFDLAHNMIKTEDPAKVMAQRCRYFEDNPPSEWNGTYVFTTK